MTRAAPIRLGIVGANVERGWARDAHLPALQQQSRFVISAVSARSQQQADAAAAHFGSERGHGDTMALVRDPGVDMVVVTVRVPEHRAVVLAALEAGKQVYCEWPLARDVAEAEEIAAAVPPGRFAVIGTQGVVAPATRQVAQLLKDGALGRPLVLRAYNTAAPWGPSTAERGYLQDKANGASLATIGMGHLLAAIETLVGPWREVDARGSILWPSVRVEGSGETMTRTVDDHILVLGEHASGCVSSVETIGGRGDRPASIEIVGDNGWVRIAGRAPGTYQIATLELTASFDLPAVPTAAAPNLTGPAANLAEVYAQLARDFDAGVQSLPGFADAARLTRLIAAIDAASATGVRQRCG